MMWRRREAEAFANALSGQPVASDEVARLIATAERISGAAAAIEPTPAFRSAVRTSLTAEAAGVVALQPVAPTRAHHQPFPLTARLRRRAAILTAAVVTIFGLAGVGTASASALPGDTLHPVKRGLEEARLALKRGEAERGAFELELATERLSESAGLIKHRRVPDSLQAETLTTYSEQAGAGSEALVRSFRETSQRSDIVTINRFATKAHSGLTGLQGQLGGPAATALTSAQEQLTAIVELSAQLCPSCEGLDAGVVSEILAPPPGGTPAAPAPPAPAPPAPPAPAAPQAAPPVATASSDEQVEEDEEQEEREEEEDEEDESRDEAEAPTGNLKVSPLPSTPSPSPSPSPTTTVPTTPPPPLAPTADFTWSQNPGNGNELRIDFEDASSADVSTWSWDFGDGTSSQEESPQNHDFPATDTYLVTLTVTNAAGGTHAVTKAVEVPVP